MGRWSAGACLPTRFSVLWSAAWVACSDKSRSSKSVEVRRIWEVYDESLLSVHSAFWEGVRSSLLAGYVSSAWSIWSFSAEVSLVGAFVGALVFAWVAGLLSSGMSVSVVPWSVGFALILGLGMVRLSVFSRMHLSHGLSFFGAGLVVFYPYWTVFLGMVLLCLVTWSSVSSEMRLLLLVLVVPLVALTLLSLLLLVFRFFGNHVRV